MNDSVYGSDRDGLVWAYWLSPQQAPRNIDAESASRWLQDSGDAGSFLWLHFSLSNAATIRWLRAHLRLPESFYDSLQETAVSTRLEQQDEHLVAMLLDLQFNALPDSSSISSVSLYIGPRLVVSARLRPLRSVDRLRASVRAGRNFRSSAELLAQLLREQAGVLSDTLRESTGRVDAIEDQLLANRVTTSRRELGTLRRLLVRLQRLLAPEPASLFRLLSRPPAWVTEVDAQELRQAAEEFATAIGDSSALAERVKLLQEELTSLVTEQTNHTLFVLTLVTVLALPVNIATGLLGMNVGGVPLAASTHGFSVVVSLLAASTALLAWLLWRRFRD
jgi:zinc transporter